MRDLRRYLLEGIGTGWYVAAYIGSSLLGNRLSGGAEGIGLLIHALATGVMLFLLVAVFSPATLGRFNPAVALAEAMHGVVGWRDAAAYVGMQFAGAIVGTLATHYMFGLPLIYRAPHELQDWWLNEALTTFGMVWVTLSCLRYKRAWAPIAGLYVTAFILFSNTLGLANPAIILVRAFEGLPLRRVGLFIAAQLGATLLGVGSFRWLFMADDAAQNEVT